MAEIRVWVEIFTTQRFQEQTVECPDAEWDAMTPDQRQDWMALAFEDYRNELADGGFEQVTP